MFGFGAPITFIIIALAAIISGVKILKEYERGVAFRLGRMVGARDLQVSDLKKPLCKNPEKLDKEIRSALAETGETPAPAH